MRTLSVCISTLVLCSGVLGVSSTSVVESASSGQTYSDSSTDLSSVAATISSGGVLPTVFPSTDTVVGAYRHGTYPSWGNRTHLGVDVKESPVAGEDEPVHAMAAGTVVDVVSQTSDMDFKSLGYMVLIRHRGIGDGGANVYSLYLHLAESPLVGKGSAVTKGQRIGSMGLTGAANGVYHTHLEIRYFSSRLSNYQNIYGPLNCDLRNAGVPPESTDGDDCDAADYKYFDASWENPQTFTVPAPSAPGNLKASDGTYRDKVRVTWSAVSRDGISYSVYRSTCTSCTRELLVSNRTSTLYDDMTASAGRTYYYYVKARSSDGISIYSPYNTGYRAR